MVQRTMINTKKFQINFNKSDAQNVTHFEFKINFTLKFKKLIKIGVKIVREDFLSIKPDDPKIETVKVILINAPCSKSALMNPMEFLFQEGEDVRFLRDYTLDVNNPAKLKKCIQNESALLKHALKCKKF